MRRLLVIVLLIFLAGLMFGQDKTHVPRAPGIQIAQINMYEVDGYMYDISYYDKQKYKTIEDLFYEIFKRFVANNEAVYVHSWVDQIKREQQQSIIKPPADSTLNKIIEYHIKLRE